MPLRKVHANLDDEIRRLVKEGSVDEDVRRVALEASNHPQGPIIGVQEWVRNNVRYVPDPADMELLTNPRKYAVGGDFERVGDCDDMAIMSCAMLNSIGIRSKVRLLAMSGWGYDHAIAIAFDEELNKWVNVDPSSTKPVGWEYDVVRKKDL